MKSQALPLKGLIEDDGSVTYDEDIIQNKLIEYYESLASEATSQESIMSDETDRNIIFNEQEVADALE